MKTNRNVRGTAIHEAGHAVVAMFVGRKVAYASLVPNDDHVGHVRYAGRPKRSLSTDQTLAHMTTALAGVTAERRDGFRPRRWSWQGDWETAANGASSLCGGDMVLLGLYLRVAERRAKLLVELHWAAIQKVADNLEAKGTLSGEEIREIARGPRMDLATMQRLIERAGPGGDGNQ